MSLSVVAQKTEIPSVPEQRSNDDPPITSPDALPLSYRRLLGDGDSGIFGKNPSAPEQESNLRPSHYYSVDLPLTSH